MTQKITYTTTSSKHDAELFEMLSQFVGWAGGKIREQTVTRSVWVSDLEMKQVEVIRDILSRQAKGIVVMDE